MAKTSVHLKPCNIAASESHNKREKELDYVRKELSHLNESFSYTDRTLQAELAKIKREVKQKTGRKLQKNAIPLKEGVIVIGENTTMSDIRKYCDICKQRFGIQPLQIHIHRDEGHIKSKEWKPNLHAHIVWGMYNEAGKNVRLSREDCAEMQTILAETLGMERGKQSNKKHLSSLEFKLQEQEKTIEQLEKQLKDKTELSEKLRGAYEGAKQGASDVFTGKARKRAEEAEKLAQRSQEMYCEALEVARRAEEKTKAVNEELAKVNKTLQRANEALYHAKYAVDNVDRLQEEKKKSEEFLKDSAKLGLTARQMVELREKGQISCNQIQMKEGAISKTDGKPIMLRIKAGVLEVLHVVQWEKVWNWCRDVIHNPWYSVNGIPNDRSRGMKI